MATATTRLALRLPDPTDLVSVTTDLNASMSALDAAVGYEVVTALPAAPYKGKPVTVSTDGYRTYFSNGTVPASGSWVEIPNSSGSFGSNLNFASGAQLVIGADTNLFRGAANVLRTNDAFTADGVITASGGLTVSAGNFKIGSATYRNKLSSQTTVSNTTTETAIATLTIPANDAVVGAIYRIHAFGTLAVASATTPTITFRAKIGGAAGTTIITLGAVTVRSGATDGLWNADLEAVVSATGVSGSLVTEFKVQHNFLTSATTYTNLGPIVSGAATIDTTASKDLVIDAIWGTASGSNTITCLGYVAERAA